MTKSEKQGWEKVRARGFVSYLLRRGLLAYGLGFGILMTLGNVFIWHEASTSVRDLLIRLAQYVFGFGVCMGTASWFINVADAKRPTEDDDAAKPEAK